MQANHGILYIWVAGDKFFTDLEYRHTVQNVNDL